MNFFSSRQLIIWLVVLFLIQSTNSQKTCHYSCSECLLPYHQYCKSCIDGYDLKVVRNPSQLPTEYNNLKTITGSCVNQQEISIPNALGIIILICSLIFIPILKTPLLFYIVSTLQSLSLLAVIQIRWLQPVSYLLNSLQYLSPCNIITTDTKQNSWEMRLYSYGYLDRLYVQPQLQKSLAFLGVLNIIVFLLIFATHLVFFIKTKYFYDSCRQVFCLSEWGLKKFVNFLNCLFYFLIQETILSFVVSFQFLGAYPFAVGAIIAYSFMIVLYCIQIIKFKIGLFPNRLIQYYSIIKKIIYPIFVVVPFGYQYFLIVLMAINCALEGIFDYKINAYPAKSRSTVFKISQFITILFFGIFFAADDLSVSSGPPMVTNYLLSIFVCLIIFLFFGQIVLGLKQKISGKKIEQKQSVQNKLIVPEVSVADRNNNMGLMSTKRQERRQSTEESFIDVENKNKEMNRLNQQIIQAPKAERSDTKDSSIKKSKDDIKQEQYDVIQLQEPEAKKAAKAEENEQAKKKRELQAKRNKNNEKLKDELKKRYGV